MPVTKVRSYPRRSRGSALLTVVVTAALVIGGQPASAAPPAPAPGPATSPAAAPSLVAAHAVPAPTGSASRPDGRAPAVRPADDVVVDGTPAQQRRVAEKAQRQATSVTHHVTIVPVWWGETQPPAPNTAAFQDATARVSSYFAEVTRGQVVVDEQATVLAWEKLDIQPTCSTLYRQMEQKARAAQAAAGISDVPGHHLVAYFPPGLACDWAGQATLGRGFIALNGYLSLREFGHEFGHNLGLHHSNGLTCPLAGVPGARELASTSCSETEYADAYDLMGTQPVTPRGLSGHLSGDQLRMLGVDGLGIANLATTSEVTLEPIAGDGEGTRLLQIPADGVVYSVEYRAAVGRDVWIDDDAWIDPTFGSFSEPGEGLVVRRRAGAWDKPGMIDVHPELGARLSPALRVGESLTTADGNVTIEYLSNTEAGAVVRVERANEDETPPVVGSVSAFLYDGPVPEIGVRYDDVEDEDTGIANVEVMFNGTIAHVGAPADPFEAWNDEVTVRDVGEGPYSVDLRVTDLAGNVVVQDVEVELGATPSLDRVRVAGLAKGDTPMRAVPVLMAWRSMSTCELYRHRVTRGARTWRVGGNAQRARVTAARGANSFKVSAISFCGKATRSTAATVGVDPVTRHGRHGRWATARHLQMLGGSHQRSTKRGATFKTTLRGRSVGWVAATGPRFGKAAVFVDGRRVAVVDLRSSQVKLRQQVWVRNFARVGRHKIKVVNLGTRGRPVVSVDGFTTLR